MSAMGRRGCSPRLFATSRFRVPLLQVPPFSRSDWRTPPPKGGLPGSGAPAAPMGGHAEPSARGIGHGKEETTTVMSTGLVIIDIQNDYFPGGQMVLEGSLEAASHARRLLGHFRGLGLPVIHVQHVSKGPGATFFLPGSEGCEIHEIVRPLSGEPVVQKHYPNAFRDTLLLHRLLQADVRRLVLAGMIDPHVHGRDDAGSLRPTLRVYRGGRCLRDPRPGVRGRTHTRRDRAPRFPGGAPGRLRAGAHDGGHPGGPEDRASSGPGAGLARHPVSPAVESLPRRVSAHADRRWQWPRSLVRRSCESATSRARERCATLGTRCRPRRSDTSTCVPTGPPSPGILRPPPRGSPSGPGPCHCGA